MENNPNQPPNPPQTIVIQNVTPDPSNSPGIVKLSFSQRFTGFFHYFFGEGRIFLYLIAAGVLIAKFGDFFMSLLLKKSKKELDSAVQKDAQLKAQEDSEKAQADALVKKANDLPSTEAKVTEDWNVKK